MKFVGVASPPTGITYNHMAAETLTTAARASGHGIQIGRREGASL
jgi:fructose-specific phosphotransferase system component IIB